MSIPDHIEQIDSLNKGSDPERRKAYYILEGKLTNDELTAVFKAQVKLISINYSTFIDIADKLSNYNCGASLKKLPNYYKGQGISASLSTNIIFINKFKDFVKMHNLYPLLGSTLSLSLLFSFFHIFKQILFREYIIYRIINLIDLNKSEIYKPDVYKTNSKIVFQKVNKPFKEFPPGGRDIAEVFFTYSKLQFVLPEIFNISIESYNNINDSDSFYNFVKNIPILNNDELIILNLTKFNMLDNRTLNEYLSFKNNTPIQTVMDFTEAKNKYIPKIGYDYNIEYKEPVINDQEWVAEYINTFEDNQYNHIAANKIKWLINEANKHIASEARIYQAKIGKLKRFINVLQLKFEQMEAHEDEGMKIVNRLYEWEGDSTKILLDINKLFKHIKI